MSMKIFNDDTRNRTRNLPVVAQCLHQLQHNVPISFGLIDFLRNESYGCTEVDNGHFLFDNCVIVI
jgi:hypothetical protein